MIAKGQATYLQTLISQYTAANIDLVNEMGFSDSQEDVDKAGEALVNAKRKLDNYIAKLTETGK